MSEPTVSFEFFPPKSLDASFQLWEALRSLRHLDPAFVSVTYGAGGTTRELTHEAVETIRDHTGVEVAAHLTCVNASKDETLEIAQRYAAAGVSKIVALRGDPPDGSEAFEAHGDGFASSVELVEALASVGTFDIIVGAYPDPHPEAGYEDADVDWLKRKVDAGATSAITQFFFEAETFLRFRDRCDAAGIDIPVLPGILPIQSWNGVRRFAERCGARIPDTLALAFEAAERDERSDLLALTQCTTLCTRLLDEGAGHLHFYTLNKPDLTREVIHALGLAPAAVLENVA
ncbi:MAG: methylenetetrahydrofolate reductase [NAD(P)H] [Rhodobacteraceae bacterium]|nr:MAG: methylenetetrahydrofolate reductase [NAD(P)H] [Paracoccaceae bacterium]